MALVDISYNGGGSTLMVDSPQGRVKPSTNGTNGISRLAQMQARFQQKQLQEKEQKLLRLYESQQQRAFQRVGRGSAGSSSVSSTTSSTTSSSSLGNGKGKVRQLFDERRTQTKNTSYKTPGWDRSYPLEPLDNARYRQPRQEKLSRGASLERINTQPIKKVVSRSRSQVRPGNLINGGYVERSRQPAEDYDDDYNNYYQDEVDASYYHRDRNANRYNSQEKELEQLFAKSRIYDEEPLRDGETFDDSQLFKKLTNVGGILLMKERTMNEDKYKTYNMNNKRMPATEANARTPTTQQPLRRRDNDVPQRAPPAAAAQARTPMKPTPRKQEMVSSPPPSNGPLARRQLPTKETSSPPLRTVSSNNNRPSAPAPSVATSRSTSFKVAEPTAPYKAATSRPSPRAAPAPVQDNLTECNFCGRRFATDRVAMHQDICARTGQKKRKVFDPVKQRVKGTEAEAYVKNASKQKPAKAEAPKKSDWRRKHEEFINAIRAAKEVKAHLAAGGKLSDLPPPPPSENLDYIQCQHCNRRFNQAAAERHIPRCADMQHNKPKAKAPAAKGAIAKKR